MLTDVNTVPGVTPDPDLARHAPAGGATVVAYPGETLDQGQGTRMTTVQLHEERIIQEIYRLLEPHNKTGNPIRRDTDIMKELDVDSLAVMNFIMGLEDHFDISIPLNAMAEIRTVEDLSAIVLKTKERS